MSKHTKGILMVVERDPRGYRPAMLCEDKSMLGISKLKPGGFWGSYPEEYADILLFSSARNSYDRHCVDPVKAAEDDLLGECVGLLRKLEPVMWQMRRLVKQKTNSETPECDKVYEELHAALAKCKGGE